ncbi:MAG TPA: LamG-like jellyroll fold domain-containing protein [Archangium sp.]|uniref:protein kinase domain-containing protein n=1 Tax=Archangium sp. TaxID=1872627 RepID=UPI002E371D6D|nr:LamG-like jellyroll fold domain-containing protein [Archangium sp.]HEX5750478.1 LamG-like jellyroll fold domain-containing protein [Archangium sp.]
MSAANERTATAGDEQMARKEPCPLGPGDVVARRYAIEYPLGEGTFSWVLAALELTGAPPRRVALKVLRPHFATHPDVVHRFEQRELALLCRVQAIGPSPHVVRALEPTLVRHAGLPCLVLEFIDGPSLRERLDAGRFEPDQVRRLGVGLARGLAAIHAAGGVHRDLKPSNVRLRGGHEPVIVDLGITRALWEGWDSSTPGLAPMTPRYASPEQLAGRDAGYASDIYSLGVLLHELLTGDVPHAGEALARGRDELFGWVARCLERQPERRPTAHELATALATPSRPRRRPGPPWGLPGALLLLGLGAAVLWRAPPAPAPRPRPVAGAPFAPDLTGPAWSRNLGSTGRRQYIHLASGARGDVFAAGAFQGSLDFGLGPLVSAGNDDVFVARLAPDGRPRWSRRFGDSGVQQATTLVVDAEEHVFIAGHFVDALDLDGHPLFNPAGSDVFLARLSPDGRTQWSRRFGDASEQHAVALAAHPGGGVVLAGNFRGAIDFGPGALVSQGHTDVFLARFSPEGQPLWSHRFGDARSQSPLTLAVDASGTIVLTSATEGGPGPGGQPPPGAPEAWSHVVALFGADGRHLWSQRLDGAGSGAPALATFDAQGQVVVLRREAEAPGAGPGLSAHWFTSWGHPLRRQRLDGLERAFPASLSAAPEGRLVVTGTLREGGGEMDLFLLELEPDGRILALRHGTGPGQQVPRSVAVDPWGRILLAGTFERTLALEGPPLTNTGEAELFITRQNPSSPHESGQRRCLPPPAGLVAWYPLDAPDPGAVLGAALPGRTSGASRTVTGRVRDGLALDGGYLEAPASAALDFGRGAFSVSAWLRTTDTREIRVVLDKRLEQEDTAAGPTRGYCLFLYRGRLSFQLADGQGSGRCRMHPSVSCTNYWSGHFVADGAWHLVTVTVDRLAPDGGTFYVDGRAVARFDPTLRSGSLDNGRPLRLGSRSSSETGQWNGHLDEVALWNRVLTPTEVALLYRAGGEGLCRGASTPRQSSPPPRSP